ncbi:trypsin-like peptidase domain-containing protein [Novosphingobium sp. SG720]|uniref:S1C family serine protease n=1 Tax=Novosphingobium sp. SG720 TaxID=2586998 RepID=UPI0014460034|nr:trypsin-like peptidase domain-containing protein [Novosphingobium sp. SG720]
MTGAMLRRLIASLIVSFLLVPAALADPADIAAASRGVVRVVIVQSEGRSSTLIGHGSGFAVTPEYVVTNAHVVEALRQDDTLIAGVVPPEGRGGYEARVVAYSPRNDLALLKIDGGGRLSPLSLYAGQVSDGADVSAVGYPGNVDLAQGLSLSDLVSPQAAVKTRGYVSAGRSSKEFDTILHTAPIGAGNSGGPLLDACGRVVGVNSFGTISDNGTDSAFYFAISMRELSRFLQQNGVQAHASDLPCTSIADLDRAESERAASDQARQAAEAQAKQIARARTLELARRQAEIDVLTQRDNGMAIAVLLLVATLGAGGAAFIYAQRSNPRATRIAGGSALALLLGTVAAWALRPSLQSIDARAEDLAAASGTPEAPASAGAANPARAGKFICVIDAQRSRVTVSDMTDVPITWSGDGCMNERSQYGLASDGWSRVLVPNGEDTIAVTHFDPDSRTYTVERFLMGLDAMTKARDARQKIVAPACGAGDTEARRFGQDQQAIRALLPAEPNERMRYNCQPVP